MGYVQGTATLGYYWTILRGPPTLMLVPKLTLGGASFFFFKTEQKQGEMDDAASVNWDFSMVRECGCGRVFVSRATDQTCILCAGGAP